MGRTTATWRPSYTISPATARLLMGMETVRTELDLRPLPSAAEAELRRQARVRATHFSTRIEGNRLTLAEAERVVREARTDFHGRERDVRQVRNYWNALLRVEEWAQSGRPITEDQVRRLHALVEKGPRAKPTPYRDGQNVIRDSLSGAIVYMPPEAKDVPALMHDLVAWIVRAETQAIPVPIIAGLAHYQFVTVHPYYDGNGRTGRLLATLVLHRGGYGLHGFLSLEEHHARDLPAYYEALAVHPHHNYDMGRADADVTPWVDYFVTTLAETFEAVRHQAHQAAAEAGPPTADPRRGLDHRGRVVLGLFATADHIATTDVARALGLSERMARVLLKQWVADGFLVVTDPSRRKRAYALSAIHRQSIGT